MIELPDVTVAVDAMDETHWWMAKDVHRGHQVSLSDIDYKILLEHYEKAYKQWAHVQDAIKKLYLGQKVNIAQHFGA
jgi:hypothetical protein